MAPVELMCVKHLLGEHVETHMFLGSLKAGRNLLGFFERGLLEPESLLRRHDELAYEIVRRGYSHKSPMDGDVLREALSGLASMQRKARVDRDASLRELVRRCPECAKKAAR